MKYTKKQLRRMIRDYYTLVADEIFWGEPEPEEIDRYVRDCRFAFIENYSWGNTFPAVDVLLLLTVDPQNYQAFTIAEGRLVALHQKHRAAECLACIERKNNPDTETSADKDSEPF